MIPSADEFDLIHISGERASQSKGKVTLALDRVGYAYELMRSAGI